MGQKVIQISGKVSFSFTTIMNISEEDWRRLKAKKEEWLYLGEDNPVVPHLIKALDRSHLDEIEIDSMEDMNEKV